MLNSILVPIAVDKFIKTNIYQPYGLAQNVFYLALTNSLLAPILKIFNPYYFYVSILAFYKNKCKQSFKLDSKLYLNQRQLNEFYEKMQF